VYWGAWDGYERATAIDGSPLWSTNLGTTTVPPDSGCDQVTYGIVSSATVATIGRGATVFVGGGDGQLYALDAATGSVVWTTRLGPSPDSLVWSSPVYYAGSIYVGASSTSDCPLIQGMLYKLDATTGAIQNSFKIVPDGCIGGSLWGTPTVDPSTGNVYFATGNEGDCSTSEPYATAVVAVRLSDLSYVDSWQVPASERVFDGDFGSAPTLFDAAIGGTQRQLLGIENKNGFYYAFDRNALSAGPVWQRQVGGSGSFAPSAWDGNLLYVAADATTVRGTSCVGSLRALEPSTGAPVWEDCLDANVLGAVTAAPGVVTVAGGPTIYVVDAATGTNLFRYDEPSNQPFYGPGSIADGALYYGNSDGTLLALAPSGSPPPSSQTFSVAAGSDDGDVSVNDMATSGVYPPTGTPEPWSDGTIFGVRRAAGYEVRTPLLRFDTSSIPAGATITSASLRLYVTARTSDDGRNLVAEWFNNAAWPIDASDYTATASNTASTGVPLSSLNVNALNTLQLQNPGSISRTGYTTLRLHVDGGQPAGENAAWFAAFENGTQPGAQLVINWSQ
jgi:polyvinyl alcohol dehydrogenase (cytochrome)